MNRYPFAVRDQTYCVWDHHLRQRNETFLRSLDGQYFQYLIDVHVPKLEGENAQRAAVTLRAGYHHSLETMFSLLGALTQAPWLKSVEMFAVCGPEPSLTTMVSRRPSASQSRA